MSNVVPVSRSEYRSLRDLCRQWESHALSAESEVTALRGQYRRAQVAMKSALRAIESNDPIALDLAADQLRDEVIGE